MARTDVNGGSGKLTAGYVRGFKCLSDCEKKHTLTLCGVFCGGSTALAPIITQQMTAQHREHCYTTVGGKMNTLLLLLPHSASDLTIDVTDPHQPVDRSGDRK